MNSENNMSMIILFIVFYILFICIFSYCTSKSREEIIIKFISSLFIPVLGPVLIIICSNVRGSSKTVFEEMAEDKFENEEYGLVNPIDVRKELSHVPMIDALNINDFETRRKLVMETMQNDDIYEYLDNLKEALMNEDIETVHYASAIIMQTQKKINDLVSKMKAQYENDKESIENIYSYEDVLQKIILSGLYDDRNLKKYYEEYKKISDIIFSRKDNIEERYLYNRIKVDLMSRDLEHAKKICSMYKHHYPLSENMIVSSLKYCVMAKNKNRLNKIIEYIKDKKIQLSYHSNQYIEFFNQQ